MDQTFVYKDGANLSLNVHSFLEKCLRISLPSCQSLTVDKTRWEVWIKFSRKILLCTRKKPLSMSCQHCFSSFLSRPVLGFGSYRGSPSALRRRDFQR